MELARGAVGDRVWGCTIASFAMRQLTGELAVGAGSDHVRVVLYNGAVVAAWSSLVADSAARIGMTLNVVTSTQVVQVSKLISAAPERDEIEVIADALRLAPDLAQRLRRRVIAQRAARTFALDRAPYVLDDQIRMAVVPGGELDMRGVLYLGARNYVPAGRLASDVRLLGGRVAFSPELIDDLGQFGFGPDETPVIDALRDGASVDELVADRADYQRRLVEAVTYALAAWMTPQGVDVPIDANPAVEPAASGSQPSRGSQPTLPPTRTIPPPVSRTVTPIPSRAAQTASQLLAQAARSRSTTAPVTGAPATTPPTGAAGTGAAGGTNPATGMPMTPLQQAKADAEAARKRGDVALKREQHALAVEEFAKCVQLEPRNGVYAALLAWAKFIAAPNRRQVAGETRRALQHAINDTEDSTPQLYLGRVERMLGNQREALRIFREVLEWEPGNRDAISEARVLEQRLEGQPDPKAKK